MTDKLNSNESNSSSSLNNENIHPKSNTNIDEDYGYYYYPERTGRKLDSFTEKLNEGRKSKLSFKCMTNVYWCAQKR